MCFIQLLFSTRSTWEGVVSVLFPWPQCTICAVKAFASPQSFCVTINTLKTFFGSKILLIAAGLIVLYQLTVFGKPDMEMMTDSALQCLLWWNEQTKRSMGDFLKISFAISVILILLTWICLHFQAYFFPTVLAVCCEKTT